MKRTKKFKSVNGVTFELKQRNFKNQQPIKDILHVIVDTSKMLHECYERPSETKRDIFNKWWNWYTNTDNVYAIGVRSYNTHMFTLQGYIQFNEFSYGIIDITPTHNYIWVDHLDMFQVETA